MLICVICPAMKRIIHSYRQLPRYVYYLVTAEFFIQLISSSFFMLLNYYLQDNGYSEAETARIGSYRFVSVLLLAVPLGFFIRGKKMKPLFLTGAILVPLLSIGVIYSIAHHYTWLIKIFMLLWGFSFMFLQVTGLPFIINNVRKDLQTEAISLFFQTYGVSMMLAGVLNYVLKKTLPDTFHEENLLLFFSALGFVAIVFVLLMHSDEKPHQKEGFSSKLSLYENVHRLYSDYDWRIILRVEIPTLIIAMGAGFTIPFINLFFRNVHHVNAENFSLLSSFASILVSVGAFFIPHIRKRYGFHIAITAFQSMAILALILMAATEWFAAYPMAAVAASALYIIRQPLMNVAGPATSELTLNYAGKRNREIISSLSASIWSGSWLFSSWIFAMLKDMRVSYANIILLTSTLYCLGVVWYYLLINEYKSKVASGEINHDDD